jgi:hypothetical protein
MVKNLILQVDQIKMQQIHLHGLLELRKCSAKDDIIDVYAHLRGEGPKASTAQDPRPLLRYTRMQLL